MNAKRWAAHAALMATLVAGLTACGGGGDSAPVAEAKVPEEQLSPGLDIMESTGGDLPTVGQYMLKVVTPPTQTGINKITFQANDEATAASATDVLEAYVIYDSNTKTVDKAVIVRIKNNQFSAAGCGITTDFVCSGIVINPSTPEIRASSVVLKELTFDPFAQSSEIISDPATTYAGTGSLKASGSLTP